MLRVENLHVSFGGSHILRGVTLEVRPHSVFCIMGRNGVGKTTTLKTLVGLYRPASGHIHFKDRNITRLAPEDRARLGIGYVPQGRCIFPHLTVEENLLIGAIAQGKKQRAILDRIHALFPILKDFRHRKGGMLSGGQQQQLAIARALMTDPDLLILDEPTEGIQPNIIDHIGDTIKILQRGGHHNETGLLLEASQLLKRERDAALLANNTPLAQDLAALEADIQALLRSPRAITHADLAALSERFNAIRRLTPPEGQTLGKEIAQALAILHAEKRVTILLIEQYLDFCRELADDFAILDRGAVAAQGPIAALNDDLIKKYLTV